MNKFASYTYLILTLIASFFIHSIHNIQALNYDWDLDNNMYFGRRLWEGELLWSKEFHDKFPFVQYLFAIPSLSNSLRLWMLFSLLESQPKFKIIFVKNGTNMSKLLHDSPKYKENLEILKYIYKYLEKGIIIFERIDI